MILLLTSITVSSLVQVFETPQTYRLEPDSEVNCATASSSSHAEPPYYDHLPTDSEPSYDTALLPLGVDVAEASTQAGIGNLFPQALFAPASLELPVQYDTVTPPTTGMDSVLNFFAIADYNRDNGSNPALIDYHSSDHIFDDFHTTFGSMENFY